MLKNLNDALEKTCLLGIAYFNIEGELIKQQMLAGKVFEVDAKNGITLMLIDSNYKEGSLDNPKFIIPANLDCWFVAPKGEFHTTSEGSIPLVNPDYLVSWDVHQTQSKSEEKVHQWWEWVARTTSPVVGDKSL